MTKYYFSYGSNMHEGQMFKRCPNARFVENIKFMGWKFAFSPVHTGANIFHTGDEQDHVWGCLYEITDTCEAVLDECEGIEQGYYKKHYINHEQYQNIPLLIYTVPDCAGSGLPYMDYHGRIIDALKQRDICDVYTAQIFDIGHLGVNFPNRNYQGDADGREVK